MDEMSWQKENRQAVKALQNKGNKISMNYLHLWLDVVRVWL